MIVAFVILGIEVHAVNAQSLGCPYESALKGLDGKDMEPISGANIEIVKSAEGAEEVKNVIVYGQDKEEEGVSLTITINAIPGKIIHNEWDKRDVCRHSSRYQPGRDGNMCDPSSSPDFSTYGYTGEYYYKSEKYCKTNLFKDVKRNVSAVRVWLQPNPETLQWMGWGTETKSGKASLHYIFPSRWMVGSWTGDGFVTSGTPDFTFSEAYYENWLKQMHDYNFLAGDSQTLNSLWSVTLDEVSSPIDSSVTSLAVFGSYILSGLPYPVNTAPTGPVFSVDYDRIVDRMNKPGKKWAESKPKSPDLYYEGEARQPNATIRLLHIPIDLPGVWYIGVMVEMEKAYFEHVGPYGSRTVKEATPIYYSKDFNWFTPDESGYNMDSNYFFTYVLLSSPCNEFEEKGCWDETY